MKGYVTTELAASRILTKGKIEELPFTKGAGCPFSLFFMPKDTDAPTIVLADVKLYQDDETGPCPFNVGMWTEPSVIELNGQSTLLDDFDVFWGSGNPLS